MRSLWILCAFLLVVLFSPSCLAQLSQNDTGVHDHQAYVGDHENINPLTGNLNINIPLIHLPGRSGHDLNLSLSYNSNMWTYTCRTDPLGHTTCTWQMEPLVAVGVYGWNLGYPVLNYTRGYPIQGGFCDQNYVLLLESGDKHAFSGTQTNCFQTNQSGGNPTRRTDWDAPNGEDDRSYISFNANTNTATLRDGTRLVFPGSGTNVAQSVTDRNGNKISAGGSTLVSGITDSVGRSISFTFNANGSYQTVSWTDDSGGTPQTNSVTFTYSPLTTTASFPFTPVETPTVVNNQTINLLASITLPNQTAYTLQYNNYGELSKITYPTGGYTRYDYANFNAYSAGVRFVTAKHVCRGSTGTCATEDTTTFQPTWSATNNPFATVTDTITFPDGVIKQVLTANPSTNHFITQVYSGTTLVRTVDQTLNSAVPSALGRPLSQTITLDDGKQSTSTFTYL